MVRAYLRRPLLVLLVLVAALGAGAAGFLLGGTTYTASVRLIVLPPRSDATGTQQNPLAGIDGNTPQLALVVAAIAATPEVANAAEQVGAQLLPADTSVSQASGAQQLTPQVLIRTEAPSARAAEQGATRAVATTRDKLRELQASQGSSDPARQVVLAQVSPPAAESAGSSARLRPAVALALAAGLLTFAGTLVLSRREPTLRARLPRSAP